MKRTSSRNIKEKNSTSNDAFIFKKNLLVGCDVIRITLRYDVNNGSKSANKVKLTA
jgi:hypothetical protein